ncbi:hypothetical protein RO3G_08025 [Rhizopus delemar RA 99-880]|uniref:Uncharacterized protein n=1 Tax=Rhizopus delemar (strain RA 99-880 / ATCC MYA-4621 / FGSC 9543 / NRRL 43880) TaxID=246409 RepID=I1C4E0_RHIO9|nr:hypothetical protein RO3G_08025 [Rhizopus delemar RA 99-880]|eukprot:EIE83320.1 hypothetical protein RO3G_08025 [Rhizopus delemar RA 99-880]
MMLRSKLTTRIPKRKSKYLDCTSLRQIGRSFAFYQQEVIAPFFAEKAGEESELDAVHIEFSFTAAQDIVRVV